jgi:vacuolar-type H+-ATPase subunit H
MNSIVKTLIAIDKEATSKVNAVASEQAKVIEKAHEEANEIYRTHMKEADMKIAAMKDKYKKKFETENAARANEFDVKVTEMKNRFEEKKDDIVSQIVNSIVGV